MVKKEINDMNLNNSAFLKSARRNKKDEFYTRMSDIEKEMKYHLDSFADKTVYLNCDSINSNFWHYFVKEFNHLRIKKLIATSYNNNGVGTKLIYDGNHFTKSKLLGNGDFRSEECRAILAQSDIVVTNPPFSLARDWLELTISHNKKFIMLGTLLLACTKLPFEYFKKKLCWFGKSIKYGDRKFNVPNHYDGKCYEDEEGRYINVKGVRWITNLDYHECSLLDTRVKYDSSLHLKLDDYDAINCDRVKDVPMNYDGLIAVPVTIFDKLNRKQFEIVALVVPKLNGKSKFKRILIKKIKLLLKQE